MLQHPLIGTVEKYGQKIRLYHGTQCLHFPFLNLMVDKVVLLA